MSSLDRIANRWTGFDECSSIALSWRGRLAADGSDAHHIGAPSGRCAAGAQMSMARSRRSFGQALPFPGQPATSARSVEDYCTAAHPISGRIRKKPDGLGIEPCPATARIIKYCQCLVAYRRSIE